MKSLPELLKILWQEGYFKEARELSEIIKNLSEKGFRVKSKSLSVSLMRAVRQGYLTRSYDTGHWKYAQRYEPSSVIGKRIELFDRYDFHKRIKEVSFKQFEDGYFKEAIQNALVEVIDQVKIKTKHPNNNNRRELDGDDLMQHVFGCDNQMPKIKFNRLKTSLDKAEQRGFMYLFKGIVGIRDKKAHLNFFQNDSLKTIEYLSLASLLLRLLDENS